MFFFQEANVKKRKMKFLTSVTVKEPKLQIPTGDAKVE